MSDEQLIIHRKSWNSCSNHKPENVSPVIHNQCSGRRCPPVWSEPKGVVPARKVAVLYYISRNGHLEHPHLIDVPMSSPNGLYLKGNRVLYIGYSIASTEYVKKFIVDTKLMM